jgi:CPA1 family monovalent cation:H+ antiporter
VGIGRLLAVSAHAELNALASVKYRREFGPQGIYILPTASESATDKQRISSSHGALLFREDVDYNTLSTWLNEGAEVRATSLTETFDFDSYNEKYGERTIPLFALDAKKRLHVFAHGAKIKPGPGWQVVALVRPEDEGATKTADTNRPEKA